MKVLMLGWEVPPHLTGGLGKASTGLAGGLAQLGVETHFVIPRRGEATRLPGVHLVECHGHGSQGTLPDAGEAPHTDESLRILAVESTLTPYARPDGQSGQSARFAGGWGPAEEPAQAEGPLAERRRRLQLRFPPEIRQRPTGCAPPPRVSTFRGGYGDELLGEVQRFARVVADMAAELEFDVVHAHDWMTFPAGMLLKERFGKPLVCHFHSAEEDRNPHAPDQRLSQLEGLALSVADRVLAVSHYEAKVLARHHDVDIEDVEVVHNALDLPASKAPRADTNGRSARVMFLGRVTAQKGPERFLEAAERVLREEPSVRFDVGGSGDGLADMEDLAASLGIRDRVRFHGFLNEAQVDATLAGSDVLVMPSVSEPFGLVALEALAAAVPAVVSRTSGVREVLPSQPSVDFWDVDAMAREILALVRDPDLRRRVAAAGHMELEALRWEHAARKVLAVYQELSP